MTIAGVSAGGAAVLQLLTVPRAKGLFHKAAVESGVGWWAGLSQAEFEEVGVLAAAHAGLSRTATAEQLRRYRSMHCRNLACGPGMIVCFPCRRPRRSPRAGHSMFRC